MTLLQTLATYLPSPYFARDSGCSHGVFPGGPGLYDGLCTGNNVDVQNVGDILIVLGNILRILFAVAGALAVIFIIIGGIFYVASAGDPGRIKRAKDIITQAITGLVIMLVAYGVVTFIAQKF